MLDVIIINIMALFSPREKEFFSFFGYVVLNTSWFILREIPKQGARTRDIVIIDNYTGLHIIQSHNSWLT